MNVPRLPLCLGGLGKGRLLPRPRSFCSSPASQRVCIVGSGPSGFYSAKYLMKSHPGVKVDMIERLPTPFGLVRFGVAPDHPEVKSVINDFEKVAQSENFRFFGNVRVGSDVSLRELRDTYDAVVLASGAPGEKSLGVEGEDLPGVFSARRFVGWYNVHPDASDLLVSPFLQRGDQAVVIGHGNVALDVARVLTKRVEALEKTDISKQATDALRNSKIRHVHVMGRRGPAQASFTNKELRELLHEDGVVAAVDPKEFEKGMTNASREEIKDSRAKKRSLELFEKMAENWGRVESGSLDPDERVVQIRFLLSPVRIEAGDAGGLGVSLQRMTLEGAAGAQRAKGEEGAAGGVERLGAALVVKSVGYAVEPLEGLPTSGGKGKSPPVPHTAGKVEVEVEVEEEGDDSKEAGGRTTTEEKTLCPLFVVGWLKRGPSGVIATNIPDAQETVGSLVKALAERGRGGERAGVESLLQERATRYLPWSAWMRLKEEEARRGEALGKSASKIGSVDEMLRLLS
uniref:NADPH:adrenodoxin oxidoreductase, mitochondrial n=1 Tax=Chromera velia CCMP2878 TaxID=1169474 RepID=A0A0G4EYD7_9ALVE|eukprot:Cvel_14280.t1-p1 / transcript=Cvel_14280.t1 / gene=Cvel_14280 / organism=Chromera_velia_CCMP2878 / gene_product=NADPH:adrenodoxin oxidoreductase, mitochondrial, putative / transcript_product=NADPH:adrenodoxin oxidoreductase, mitochondrial, putative / location=Cvel_scaffold1008:11777-22340(-) / protein_length=514 / sequence_SO=supercontig / SO=protein_coding / is_pseudo=false